MQRAYGDFDANFNVNYSRISYSLQKIARWRSLIISLRKKTEITEKKTETARWRSPLFFITEKDGNNRKKQKLLAGARLSSSLQKKTEITEINGNCLPAASLTMTLNLTFLNTNYLLA